MTVIELETEIEADIERCFDMSRDIDVHLRSTEQTKEKAVAGRTSGLCELGDRVTWEAVHFGIRQRLSVEITKFERPHFFEDQMTEGAFKSMRHAHHFRQVDGRTIMNDHFEYRVPYGVLGWIFDKLVLKRYMTRFLRKRNQTIKRIAETNSL